MASGCCSISGVRDGCTFQLPTLTYHRPLATATPLRYSSALTAYIWGQRTGAIVASLCGMKPIYDTYMEIMEVAKPVGQTVTNEVVLAFTHAEEVCFESVPQVGRAVAQNDDLVARAIAVPQPPSSDRRPTHARPCSKRPCSCR